LLVTIITNLDIVKKSWITKIVTITNKKL